MKPDRLTAALGRVARGQSNVLDARLLRDALIEAIEAHFPILPDPAATLDALRDLKL